MVQVRIYECKGCGKKYIVIDTYCNYCVDCGHNEVEMIQEDLKYSLYNNNTQTLLD